MRHNGQVTILIDQMSDILLKLNSARSELELMEKMIQNSNVEDAG